MRGPGRTWPVALLSLALGSGGCGGGTPASAPPPVVPPTPPPPVVAILEGTVPAGGSISPHYFTMGGVGEVRARLVAFAPVDAKLEITLCQGDIRVLNTCPSMATGFETDVVRARFLPGTNTVYVAKRRGDAYQEDTIYRLELQYPP